MAEIQETTHPKWATKEPVVVSTRTFRQVFASLALVDKAVAPGTKVLSVGEGLTDFAKTLAAQHKVTAIGVDPIYSRPEVLLEDPIEAFKAINSIFGDKVRLRLEWADDPSHISLPDRERILAGSVYELPFPNKSFNLVLAHGLIEHIDFSLALPELIRVMTPGGEIRMGWVHLDLDPGGRLFAGCINQIAFVPFFEPDKGFKKAMAWIRRRPSLRMYVAFKPTEDNYLQRPEAIIIRNDHKLPLLPPGMEIQVVNPRTLNTDPYTKAQYYTIHPIDNPLRNR